MKPLLIREVPEELHAALEADAARNRRSKEKHALFILETTLAGQPANTCGELADALDRLPKPGVSVKDIDHLQATRGRRSNRP